MTTENNKRPVSPVSLLRHMERMRMEDVVKGKEREAQDLVYDAWETADVKEAYDLLKKATELDPANVDAWLGLMDYEPLDVGESIELLRKLVSIGEKNLGEKAFKEGKGHFWGLLETRPYMRARGELGTRLMEAGRYEEAIIEYVEMLKLNSNDNQGVRHNLMTCYLAVDRLDDLRRLMKRYNERKLGAVWCWAYVLERFLSGDLNDAETALQEARKQNPHAQAYFLGHKRLPKYMPDSYSIGSKEEAILAWDLIRHAWQKHPAAGAWLESQRKGAPVLTLVPKN